MIGHFSRRVLALLQFTRFALVFTAISNAQAALLLRGPVDPAAVTWMALVSIGLYTFGMTLNDIIDRRRDAQLAADRPLPSGRISVSAAHVVCVLLLAMAIVGAVMLSGAVDRGRLTFAVIGGVVFLIAFYDVAGKYLVPLGLVTLGLIRFFHASIADPTMHVPWHPILLLNHVAILSAVAYHWEQKRPVLQKRHVIEIVCLLVMLNVAIVAILLRIRSELPCGWTSDLNVGWPLLIPAAAVVGFILVAWIIHRRQADTRAAGKTLMLVGLLWLIIYDAAFVFAYRSAAAALAILAFLPVAWLCVRAMRLWSKLAAMSQRPQYIRAGRSG
jgi:4-hydroxybenzoate polyprenyltransferase